MVRLNWLALEILYQFEIILRWTYLSNWISATGPMFREWILTKIVNGERASYSAPKFARMQERTRSQMLEDIVANLA